MKPVRPWSRVAVFAVGVIWCASGCKSNSAMGDESPDSEIKGWSVPNTGERTQYIYRGHMPQMKDIEIFLSRNARTVRIEGRPFVPTTLIEVGPRAKVWNHQGRLLNDAQILALRDKGLNHLFKNEKNGKWFTVYPLAVGKRQFYPGHRKFDLIVPRRSFGEHTWHQMPYLGIMRGKYGVGTIAFHTPYTTITRKGYPLAAAPVGRTLHLFRGRVSRACKRMAAEHILEFAHIIGVDLNVKSSGVHRRPPFSTTLPRLVNKRGVGGNKFIHTFYAWDRVNGKPVDVQYPAYGAIKRPPNAVAYRTWHAAEPGKLGWIQYRDERGGSWRNVPDPTDPFKVQRISTIDYGRIAVVNPGGDKTDPLRGGGSVGRCEADSRTGECKNACYTADRGACVTFSECRSLGRKRADKDKMSKRFANFLGLWGNGKLQLVAGRCPEYPKEVMCCTP